MTVLLVLLTAVVLLAVEYFFSEKHAQQPIAVAAVAPRGLRHSVQGRPPVNIISGFEVPDHLRYHPGHTWALSESPSLVRTGLDQFATRLIGKIDKISLPQRGQWIRQGQRILTMQRDGKVVEMVSPIEGEVTEVNDAVVQNPELARRDPYGEGWLMMVKSPDAKTNFRNLISGNVVRGWMEDAATRLRNSMPAMAGAVAQDGGLVVDDLSGCLSDEAWSELTKELFLC